MGKQKEHNKLYYENRERIKGEYARILKSGRMPSMVEVADNCRITRRTVSRHLNDIDLSDLTSPFRLFGEDVLNSLRESALEGNSQAAKIFYQIVFSWSEKHEIKADVKANIKADVKTTVTLSPKIAKIVGNLIAEEKAKTREPIDS